MGNPNPDSCPTLFFPGFPENIFLILKSQKEKGIVKHYTKKKCILGFSEEKSFYFGFANEISTIPGFPERKR